MTKICLIAAFPPSIGPLSEYSYHIARELQRHKDVELTILADELEDEELIRYDPSDPGHRPCSQELPGVTVIRCWKFGSLSTPLRLVNMIRQLKPDVVWYNLVFSSFGAPDSPVAAFAGLTAPALTRAAGFYTHITLHHIVEHVDFSSNGVSGVSREKLYRRGTDLATRSLLRANSVSVLLSDYRRTLMAKYEAQNIIVGTHGTFASIANPPNFAERGNPDLRILAFGNWGTYKRLDKLLEAFPAVLEKIPNARLIVAGGNHPAAPGYWESIRDAQPAGLPVEFLGYVSEENVPKLFATSSVMVMPYDSSTGSSGPAHQACEFGVPIICADIADFRCMAADDDMAILFYKKGDASDLSEKLVTLLQSPELQKKMSEYNYEAGIQMTMANVSRNYLRWFELHKFKRTIAGEGTFTRLRNRWFGSLSPQAHKTVPNWVQAKNLLPKVSVGDASQSQPG